LETLAVLSVTADGLADAVLAGGSGEDTLQLTGGGTFDLTLPQTFASIEIVQGSDEHDTIILDEARFGGVTTFIGGTNPAQALDEIKLTGASFDLRPKTFTAIDRIALLTDNAIVTVADKVTAVLLSGIDSQNDRLVHTGEAFTADEIHALHRRGIDTIVDANGEHTDAAPQAQHLDGARIRVEAGGIFHLDAGRDSTLVEDGPLSLLTVTVPPVAGGTGRLGIDASGTVSLSSGYKAGSLVSVGYRDWDDLGCGACQPDHRLQRECAC
jgi:hypothetical protein